MSSTRVRARSTSRGRSTSRPRRRGPTPRAGSRTQGQAFTRSLTTGPGSVTARLTLRQTVNETTTFGTVESKDFQFTQVDFPALKRYSQVKIHRVGVAVLPRSYMEFSVLGVNWASVDTRQELVNLPDCEHIWAFQGGPIVRWYKPVEGVYKNWQDLPTSTTQILSGLHIKYTGLNDLQATTGGILAGIWYDVAVRGVNNAVAATLDEATPRQLEARLRALTIRPPTLPEDETPPGWVMPSIWGRTPPPL